MDFLILSLSVYASFCNISFCFKCFKSLQRCLFILLQLVQHALGRLVHTDSVPPGFPFSLLCLPCVIVPSWTFIHGHLAFCCYFQWCNEYSWTRLLGISNPGQDLVNAVPFLGWNALSLHFCPVATHCSCLLLHALCREASSLQS